MPEPEINIGMNYDRTEGEPGSGPGMGYNDSSVEPVFLPAPKSEIYPNSPHDPLVWGLDTVPFELNKALSEARVKGTLEYTISHFAGALEGSGCLSKEKLIEFRTLGTTLLSVNKDDHEAQEEAWNNLKKAVSKWKVIKNNGGEK